jgi:hypothetical protein
MELFCVAVAVVGEGEGEWLCDDCGWGGDFGGRREFSFVMWILPVVSP